MANRVITTILLGRDHMSQAFNSAARSAQRHSATIDRVGRSMVSMSSGTIKATAAIGLASTALVQGAGAALAVGQAAGVAAGALLVLPGALAAVKIGTATLKLGLDGVGEAIKASAEGGAAYEEALKKLAPAQQRFVKGVADQSKAFADLKKSVGQELFAGIADKIGPLGDRYLPIANRELSRLSGYFGQAASRVADFAGKASTVSKVSGILRNTADAGRGLVGAVKPLASALLNIVSASAKSLPGLATGLTGAAERFDQFIARVTDNGKGGKFTTWIRDGIEQIKSLGGTIRTLVGEVSKPAFRQGLSTVFEGMRTSSAAVSKEIPGLVDAVLKLVPAFSAVIAASGTSFGATLRVVTAIIRALTPAIIAFAQALVPLAPLLGTIAPIIFLIGKGMAILNAVMLANPISLVVVAIAALVVGMVVLYQRSQTARLIMTTVFSGISQVILTMVGIGLRGFKILLGAWMTAVEGILTGAVKAFGWVPEIGGKLQTAKKSFDGFKAGVNKSLDGAIKKTDEWKSAVARMPKEVRLKGQITDLNAKINAAKAKLRTVPPSRQARILGDIRQLQDRVARARAALRGIKDRYVRVFVSEVRRDNNLSKQRSQPRARGGPVKKGQPYIVGDGGRPELMVPDQNGTIMPKVPSPTSGRAWSSGGGNTYVTVNVSGFVGSETQLADRVVRALETRPAGSRKIPASAVAR